MLEKTLSKLPILQRLLKSLIVEPAWYTVDLDTWSPSEIFIIEAKGNIAVLLNTFIIDLGNLVPDVHWPINTCKGMSVHSAWGLLMSYC